MAGEAFLREIEERHNNLTDEQKERAREIANKEDINEDLHLLLLGRSAVGKSTFAGELTGGKIKGSSGPSGGTKSSDIPGQWKYIKMEKMEEETSTKTDGSNTKKAYFVYDTVGFGDVTVDLDEMKCEAKEVCEQGRHCTVFLCIGWKDRINDINTQIAFDVCVSLGMWQNVIIVITQCELTSQESDPNSEEYIRIKAIEHDWKESIAKKLESMNVEGSEIAKITEKIVFYPDSRQKPADQESRLTWVNTLITRLKDIIQSEKKADNVVPALSNGISIVLNLLFNTIERLSELGPLSCIQPSGDDQVQDIAGCIQNTDGSCATGMPAGDEQLLKEKGLSKKTIGATAGGTTATAAAREKAVIGVATGSIGVG
uniref:AIG1-type G domain-containing protein n=1 Tax=Amphimedon queenslandica TaxID=400682 RepID=A0A1X7T6H7_AMPQE